MLPGTGIQPAPKDKRPKPAGGKSATGCHTWPHGEYPGIQIAGNDRQRVRGRALRRIVILALALGWHASAEAFFCFSFLMHGGGESGADMRRWTAFPPPLPYPPPPLATGADPDRVLPSIRKIKQPPDIIDGYRFRPLEEHRKQPVIPSVRVDWRD